MKPVKRLDILTAIDIENPGLKETSPSNFTEKVAARLSAEDANWGRYRNTNQNVSKDVLAYTDFPTLWGVDIIEGASKILKPDEKRDLKWEVTERLGSWVHVIPESDAPPQPSDPPPTSVVDYELRAWARNLGFKG